METIKFVYYQENDFWVGWLEEFPDYRTQGTSLDDLKENLEDLFEDLGNGGMPYAGKDEGTGDRITPSPPGFPPARE
jgi:hypothetical protein